VPAEASKIDIVTEASFDPPISAGVFFENARIPLLRLTDRFGNTVLVSGMIVNAETSRKLGNVLVPLLGITNSVFLAGYAQFPRLYIEKAFEGISLEFLITLDGKVVTSQSQPFDVVHQLRAASLKMKTEPISEIQGETFTKQPSVSLLDIFGNLVDSASYTVKVTMLCYEGMSCGDDGCALMEGTTVVASHNGVASFTDLYTNAEAGRYSLRFDLVELVDSSSYKSGMEWQEEGPTTPAISGNFLLESKPWMLKVIPDSFDHCKQYTGSTECSEDCVWTGSTCAGFLGATAGDDLMYQPKVLLLNSTGQLVPILAGHFLKVSLVNGIAGLTGENLQSSLAGTTLVPIVDGIAQFTDLAILQEAQGVKLRFDVSEDCCTESGNTLGGLQTFSVLFGVYQRVAKLVVSDQPTDTVAGQVFNNMIKVELRDSVNSLCIFSTATIEVDLVGSISPVCPDLSKSLHFDPTLDVSAMSEVFIRYSGGEKYDNGEYNHKFLDLVQFTDLLGTELASKGVDSSLQSLFQSLDVGGMMDSNNIPTPDGRIDFEELFTAARKCVCLQGYASGTFDVQLGDPIRITVTPVTECVPMMKCVPGYLGTTCRDGNAMLPKTLDRIPRFKAAGVQNGPKGVKVSEGVVTFTDIEIYEAGPAMRLRFTFKIRDAVDTVLAVESDAFKVFPSKDTAKFFTVFLTPTRNSVEEAGTKIDVLAVILDEYFNFQPLSTCSASLIHPNVQQFSESCTSSNDVLPCNSCPDKDKDFCPGPRCPFRCDYSNAIRPKSILDPTPSGQVCAYNCKKGCSFMCGTMNTTADLGEARFQDVQIKRTGQHILEIKLSKFSVLPYDQYPSSSNAIQKQITGTLLLIDSERFYKETIFTVKPSAPFYLMSDYSPLLKYLTSNTTRAGLPFDPAPTCLVTDFYGNIAPEGKFAWVCLFAIATKMSLIPCKPNTSLLMLLCRPSQMAHLLAGHQVPSMHTQ